MLIKEIPNNPDYEISEYGDVFSKKWGKVIKLKSTKTGRGYYRVTLSMNKKNKNKYIHRLVLMAFDRMPRKGEVARHFPDGDKANNHISNLQWGTQLENAYDRDKIHKTGKYNNNENHYRCVLTNKEVQEIRDLWVTGAFYQRVLAEKYNITQNYVSNIINNNRRNFNA